MNQDTFHDKVIGSLATLETKMTHVEQATDDNTASIKVVSDKVLVIEDRLKNGNRKTMFSAGSIGVGAAFLAMLLRELGAKFGIRIDQ